MLLHINIGAKSYSTLWAPKVANVCITSIGVVCAYLNPVCIKQIDGLVCWFSPNKIVGKEPKHVHTLNVFCKVRAKKC